MTFVILCSLLLGQDDPTVVVSTVKQHLAQGDSYAAVEYIQRQGKPNRVAVVYSAAPSGPGPSFARLRAAYGGREKR